MYFLDLCLHFIYMHLHFISKFWIILTIITLKFVLFFKVDCLFPLLLLLFFFFFFGLVVLSCPFICFIFLCLFLLFNLLCLTSSFCSLNGCSSSYLWSLLSLGQVSHVLCEGSGCWDTCLCSGEWSWIFSFWWAMLHLVVCFVVCTGLVWL